MKISKLYIDSFRHLENLDFDFTYQDGDRKGQPLDKICFIGQSATGKTSLLELINNDIVNLLKTETDSNIDIWINLHKISSNITLNIDNDVYKYEDFSYYKNGTQVQKTRLSSSSISNWINNKKPVYHITSDILSNQNIKFFEEEPVLLIERHKIYENKIIDNFDTNLIFDSNVKEEIWVSLLKQNIEYLQNFLQFATELINSGSILDNSSQNKVDTWKSKNTNPLQDFSEKFDVILEKINLEVDLANTKNIISLKHKINNKNVPIQNISTGTKQLLLTAFPLYKLNTKDSIILIDEPERSLYPDMQMDLMDYYKNLAPKAQFIVATHSPFIAASFEPDERFILYFDQEGKVAIKRGNSPIGDDPNDILKNDFGVNYYNRHGEEAYQKYISLKQEVANETDPKRKKELLLETVKLGDTYNF